MNCSELNSHFRSVIWKPVAICRVDIHTLWNVQVLIHDIKSTHTQTPPNHPHSFMNICILSLCVDVVRFWIGCMVMLIMINLYNIPFPLNGTWNITRIPTFIENDICNCFAKERHAYLKFWNNKFCYRIVSCFMKWMCNYSHKYFHSTLSSGCFSLFIHYICILDTIVRF